MNKKNITVEIRGVGFVNKGAELMLHAIKQELDRRFSNVTYVVEVSYSQLANRQKRGELIDNLRNVGLGARLSGSFKKIPLRYVSKILFPDFHENINVVKDKSVDIVFDASGFAFGDQWGSSFAKKRLTNNIETWVSKGKVVILLPQAFGPFNEGSLKSEMRKLIKFSDLIFARDPVSYDYIKSITEDSTNIIPKPDFTNLIEPNTEAYRKIYHGKVAIIPNFKMITSKSKEQGESYALILEKVVKIVLESGYKPFFLMHEGKRDEEIALLINSKLEKALDIVWEDSAIGIKAIIGSCHAVITSRFHGLVSSLSQGVPCLATSWSHKYEMLLKDYDHEEGLVPLESSDTLLKDKVNNIVNESSNLVLRNKLLKKAAEQKDLTKGMWKHIFDYLESKHGIR